MAWTDVDQRFKDHFLLCYIPVCAPNICLLTAIFEQYLFAICMHRSAASQDTTLNIDGQLDIFVQGLKHLIDLLLSCVFSNDMNDHLVTPFTLSSCHLTRNRLPRPFADRFQRIKRRIADRAIGIEEQRAKFVVMRQVADVEDGLNRGQAHGGRAIV